MDISEVDEENRRILVTIRKNKTSLFVTLPPYMKGLFDIEAGDLIRLKLEQVVKRVDRNENSNNK